MGGADACQGGRDRGEERAKAAIGRSRSGSTGSAIMALFLAAADKLHWWDCLKGPGAQRRGPCPIHEPSRTQGRCFSVNLEKNAYQCFDASCGARGNVLDLWAQVRGLTIPQAAHDLAERFGVVTG